MTTNSNKIIGAVVAVFIILSIAVLVYVNLPKEQKTTPGDTIQPDTNLSIFSLIYDDEQINFTMEDLLQLNNYTGKGGYRTQNGVIKGQGNYTGVTITTLVESLREVPVLYSMKAYADDGYNLSYNYTTIIGNVNIYDPTNASDPTPIGQGNLTMVLAYYYEGDWLDESSDGKLKIVFLDEEGSITESSLWMKKVITIRLITE
ncbi:MAG: hypothetical protein JW840_02845 [Candidatus Thermoplasmatota archaeon]|nr:hypothetical protein [Candidatus Thermoplasmatota archaeon]